MTKTTRKKCIIARSCSRSNRLLRVIVAAATICLSPVLKAAAADPLVIRVGVADNLAQRINGTIERYPRLCEDDSFFSDKWLRTTLEFVILCRAVRLGGLDATYQLIPFPNSARTRFELKNGSVMVMVDFPWGDFARDESLYQSDAVLPEGSFVKGLYTRPDRSDVLAVRSLEDLKAFTAVSSSNWKHDWAALELMGVPRMDVAAYEQMGRAVEFGRADYLIGEFSGAGDLSQYINGVRFEPVPEVKVALPGTRHIAVSRKVPHAAEVFSAIQKGLRILRDRGLILKGYRTSGFFNRKVENWNVLCCEPAS
ncbi:hypothetical protein [Roseibium sediminicola]|uniref:ABC-type amino acid transport substrate-binding protein n=1 Tax=Roseibium sediminicola TaxID=2933272 RepID=A0ABT0H245_9HYPH|nr:hypothetical protein [Roseibium sp. CAU 1639]MCK7615749.1 hypothetical protein [Roseibium sp. CAU 1639]